MFIIGRQYITELTNWPGKLVRLSMPNPYPSVIFAIKAEACQSWHLGVLHLCQAPSFAPKY
jgi:hypothetical protein